MGRFRIALAQMNLTVGDLAGNVAAMAGRLEEAWDAGADLVAFPELAIPGYPPEDLLLKPAFVDANLKALRELAAKTRGTAVVGFVDRQADLHNAAAVVHEGEVVGVYHKQRLPNYGVFDELRYFQPGQAATLYRIAGAWVGVSICEDIWFPGGPVAHLALAGADVVVNINASPYHRGKWRHRHQMLAARAADYGVSLAYVNHVGGQDEIVFDGDSCVFDAAGELLVEARPFEEELLLCDITLEQTFRARLHDARHGHVPERRTVERKNLSEQPSRRTRPPLPARPAWRHDDLAEVYRALVVGTRDYVRKNGFEHVVLGLSGGIDSSLVAVVAVDALGADAVTGASLPSRYTSEGSRADAAALARALGIELETLSIEESFQVALRTLEPAFRGRAPDIAEENLQARLRGMLLMALSNKFGWLVLATGNKSEMATGYATLYGDMAGGFAVLKDVPKTLVYELARWRNTQGRAPLIPESVLAKAPSAELRPGQRDVDSLPPYEQLDPILERYVEGDLSYQELVTAGFDPDIVKRVITMVDRSEYKRRQAPPGVKITPRAFGKDRRLPITSRYRDA
ncbi:MAG: NAD+ synthase [Gemmatimonadetes bacterium]|nr:NAD+ synthase [Gemmatimonadota bacterium]